MVNLLKEKRDKYADELDGVLNSKQNSSGFRYKTNTLLTNLLLDEIYKERNYLLQAIRYMVNNQFFDEKVEVSSLEVKSSVVQEKKQATEIPHIEEAETQIASE